MDDPVMNKPDILSATAFRQAYDVNDIGAGAWRRIRHVNAPPLTFRLNYMQLDHISCPMRSVCLHESEKGIPDWRSRQTTL